MNLCKWLGGKWNDETVKKGIDYCQKIQTKWDKINNKVFTVFKTFGFKLPVYWLAYPVSNWEKLTPFSDPLTFIISEKWNKVFSIIVHELAHVEMSFISNQKIKKNIYSYIERKFPEENRATKVHIPVNLLQESVIKKVITNYKRALRRKRDLNDTTHPGYQKAWQVLDRNRNKLDLDNPVKSIFKL